MTKSTKRRPWPAMAHAKPTSWQPTQGRRSRERDAALKSQTDLDGVTFLPTQHRPLPPEPTTRLLRDVGVCGSAAVLLFSVCALIAVTMPPDVTQGVCRPSTNFCPVAYLSPTPSASPALKSAPMTTPTRSSSSPTRCVSRSSLLLSRFCPAVTVAWRAAVCLCLLCRIKNQNSCSKSHAGSRKLEPTQASSASHSFPLPPPTASSHLGPHSSPERPSRG